MSILESALTPVNREVVRITTSCWSDKRGLHIRRSLTTLTTQILHEECSMTSPDEVARIIVNLNECKDGIYVGSRPTIRSSQWPLFGGAVNRCSVLPVEVRGQES